ncbi:MAG TPA: hypothetical protein VIF35_11075 [Streptosporangiaceae bacterium]|jgi:hypothetical protein
MTLNSSTPRSSASNSAAHSSRALKAAAANIRRSAQDPLAIYLNDHLAGATGGLELARRMAGAGQIPSPAAELRQFAEEVAEDRDMLLRVMGTLGIAVRSYKVWAGWAGEKAGRLKPNGRLTARSPLSNLEELELMRLGVEGKAAGWRTLRALADRDSRLDAAGLDELILRARRQADFLEESRIRAAQQVIDAADAGHG